MVVGGAGFVGSVLIPKLLDDGYSVICYDQFFFGKESIKDFEDKIEVIEGDIRDFEKSDAMGIDIVINLAAVSQPDETVRLDPRLFYEINHEGCTRVARACKSAGVKRYVYSSTCSVYGSQAGLLSEYKTDPRPLEAYGISKLMAEKDLLDIASDEFIVTILRPGTMYGLSPKMRFDLVVNSMTFALFKHQKIMVSRPGTQWRPNVHVRDVVRAIQKVIEAPKEKIHKEIYNIGVSEQNYQIHELGKQIGKASEQPFTIEWFGSGDLRSYNVDFSKLEQKLDFQAHYNVSFAVREILEALNGKKVDKNVKSMVIAWYKALADSGKIQARYSRDI